MSTPRKSARRGPIYEQLTKDEFRRTAEFRAALRRFLRVSERVLPRFGLTHQRYLLLLMIKDAPSGKERATVRELARRLELAENTVTELASRAEEAGLVRRERDPDDRRRVCLQLTREGERRLAAAVRALAPERKALAAMLTDLETL